jgi:transposase
MEILHLDDNEFFPNRSGDRPSHYVRDERPHQGKRPAAAMFFYSPDRKGEHPVAHLQDFTGVLHADGYAGFNGLYEAGRIVECLIEA